MSDDRWQQIERLYHAALDRDAAERAAFLDDACEGDDALRREVASLLACEDEAHAFLAESAIRVAARELAESDERSLVGHQLGSYELEARLGAGGMGEVYRARDVRLDRIVAIKILAPHLADDPDFRRRFEREARSISQLSHPHICTLYDIGHVEPSTGSERAVDYLVLEYLEGETLAERLRRGPLPLDQALQTAIEIGEALAHAHGHGIVHRDLKPGNVILTAGGAKLVDFGLAKRRPAGGPVVSAALGAPTASGPLTGPRTILGTLPYMAPEQLEGKEADACTDLWAFGAVLYEMLTGRRAFEGESEAQIIAAVVGGHPKPLAALPPGTPPELDRLIRTCLARKPDDRWATAHDVVVQLRGIAGHTHEGHAASARRSGATAKQLWAAAAIVAVLAIGATALLRRAQAPVMRSFGGKPSVAVLYFENNTGNASLDWLRTGLTDMVVTDLSQSPDVDVLGTDRLYQILRELHRVDDRVVSSDTVQKLAWRAGVKTFVLGSYVKAGDAIRIDIKLQEAASGRIFSAERVEAANEAQLFPAVDDLTRRIRAKFALPSSSASASKGPGSANGPSAGSGIDRDLADVTTSSIEAYRYYADGVGLHERGRDVEAIAQLRRAVALDPGFAMALTKLAIAELQISDWASVGNDSQRALDHADRLSARERYYVEANYYAYHGQHEKSIESNKKLLALFPDHVSSRNNLAVSYSQLERYEEARQQLEDLRRRGVALSPTYLVLAGVYDALGQSDKGLEIVQEFLRRNPDNALAHRSLAGFLTRMGKTDEALAALARAEALDPAEPGIYSSRRTILLLKDQVADVEAADRKRLATNNATGRPQPAIVNVADDVLFRGRTAEALKLLGSPPALLLESGQTERALVDAQRGLANLTGLEVVTALVPPPGVPDPPASSFLAVIARAQARLGRNAEAAQAIDQLTRIADSAGNHPEQRRVRWLKGVIALDHHETTTALRELTQAQTMLEANPGEKGVPIWFALGSAYVAAGKDADAASQFQRIVDSPARIGTPIEFVRSLYFLGQIAERQGDRDKARAYYRRFVGYWGDGDIDRDRVAEARKKI